MHRSRQAQTDLTSHHDYHICGYGPAVASEENFDIYHLRRNPSHPRHRGRSDDAGNLLHHDSGRDHGDGRDRDRRSLRRSDGHGSCYRSSNLHLHRIDCSSVGSWKAELEGRRLNRQPLLRVEILEFSLAGDEWLVLGRPATSGPEREGSCLVLRA
jgi:hypothetical protein